MNYRDIYELWCEKVTDAELAAELAAMADDEKAIEDAFYTELSIVVPLSRPLIKQI